MKMTKEEEILSLLTSPVVDLWSLRAKALSEGGFLDGTLSVVSCSGLGRGKICILPSTFPLVSHTHLIVFA